MQYLMDGQHQHQLPMLQPQYENHGQQQQQRRQAATSERDAHGQRQDELTMGSQAGSDNMESGGGGSGSADEELQEELGLQRPSKKRYHRHTQHQIQELEAFFKQCPHPDDKQRKELSRELGLEPLQVKFWFQNKRTQMKVHSSNPIHYCDIDARILVFPLLFSYLKNRRKKTCCVTWIGVQTQLERSENSHLRAENDKLRAENARYKDALANATCPSCAAAAATGETMSLDEQHLRLENARLRDEVDRVSSIAAKYVGKPIAGAALSSYPPPPPIAAAHHHLPGGGDVLALTNGGAAGIDKPLVIELAVAAMDELVKMAQLGEPFWVPTVVDGVATEMLNEEEYARSFTRGVGPKSPELRSEASRETVVVMVNHVNLVEMLMDVNQWWNLFSTIVSRASTLEVFSTAVAGNYNGALQLMSAEFQLPSPLVPTREAQFVRYCKHHPDDDIWAVVDVSVDDGLLRPDNGGPFRRHPSGCLIRPLPNGHSRVTWVEHAEASDAAVPHLYLPLARSRLGLAFGARRWAAALARQCHRLAAVTSSSPPAAAGAVVVTSAEGRRSVMRLAARMAASFCAGVAASSAHQWTTLSSRSRRSGGVGEEEEEKEEEVRVTTRKSVDDPGRPPGVILNAATSFRLPVPPAKVFRFLRDDATRSKWDILSNGGDVQEVARVATGPRDDDREGNAVSLLRVNGSPGQSSNEMLILQECVTDAAGSYVVYAPVDVAAMTVVLAGGGDPDYVALLPSGFAILPDGGGGSLLTVAFQILVDSAPTAKLSLGSVATVNSLIACTVQRIKAAVVAADDKQAAPPPAAWPVGDQAAGGA
ncbi:hypothetical protein PR202_ga30785 [Eleusine coracana subsp. coracana]|uniref:Uncharacterized protein n=1 Tax=Eleusine coracana subsp. coracana TaxID=191504 RepID=A0AAV5DQA3_ELECO|nr:hypothetical protein PR202_ga30785 [Eleusine coracana subsp. coracana]